MDYWYTEWGGLISPYLCWMKEDTDKIEYKQRFHLYKILENEKNV